MRIGSFPNSHFAIRNSQSFMPACFGFCNTLIQGILAVRPVSERVPHAEASDTRRQGLCDPLECCAGQIVIPDHGCGVKQVEPVKDRFALPPAFMDLQPLLSAEVEHTNSLEEHRSDGSHSQR